MKIDASELTEGERDALAEIANMGVSRAATSLRQMVGEPFNGVEILTEQDTAALRPAFAPKIAQGGFELRIRVTGRFHLLDGTDELPDCFFAGVRNPLRIGAVLLLRKKSSLVTIAKFSGGKQARA